MATDSPASAVRTSASLSASGKAGGSSGDFWSKSNAKKLTVLSGRIG